MQVYWVEQDVAEVRDQADWLSAAELACLARFHVPKRRLDWRLGRWTAKHAVAAYLKLLGEPAALAAIEIRPAASGAPEVFFHGQPASVAISITHRDGRAACAVTQPEVAVGCDLEVVEPRSEAFISDYFSVQEQQLISHTSPDERFRILALLWSAKESALKALQTGLRMDVRCVSISFAEFPGAARNTTLATDDGPRQGAWHPLSADHGNGTFHGWYQCSGNFVRTIVTMPRCGPPITLQGGQTAPGEAMAATALEQELQRT